LDLYSLQASRDAVIKYLDQVEPNLAKQARENYGCFNKFGNDTGTYGYKTGIGISPSCEKQVIQVLRDMLDYHAKMMAESPSHNVSAEDQYFYAKQNAAVVRNAELYYRHMFTGSNTWNIRDRHMLETLVGLIQDLTEQSHSQQSKKAIVWAHNSHLGDALYTDSSARGEFNLGQLARETFGLENTYNIGFTTFSGSVTAAHNWDDDPHHMTVNKGMNGSYEKLFHDAVLQMDSEHFKKGNFLLNFRSNNSEIQPSKELYDALTRKMLERMIGVLYRPDTERFSHYVSCSLPKQFDSVIHLDRTRALKPLEVHPQWEKGFKDQVPDTYPSGV